MKRSFPDPVPLVDLGGDAIWHYGILSEKGIKSTIVKKGRLDTKVGKIMILDHFISDLRSHF